MQKNISGPILINTMFLLLKKETQTGSKLVHPDAMQSRVCFQLDTIALFGDVIAQNKAWHCYETDKHQVAVAELEFPQTQA